MCHSVQYVEQLQKKCVVKYAIKNIFHKAFTVTNDRNKTKNREFLMRKLVKR